MRKTKKMMKFDDEIPQGYLNLILMTIVMYEDLKI